MTQQRQNLYRDTENQRIAGVCSGLARYFDIDVVLVRVAFVVLILVVGGGLLAYIILWIAVSPAPPGYWDEPEPGEAQPTEDGPGEEVPGP